MGLTVHYTLKAKDDNKKIKDVVRHMRQLATRNGIR